MWRRSELLKSRDLQRGQTSREGAKAVVHEQVVQQEEMCGSRSRWSGPGRPGRAARHNYHGVTQSERKTEKSTTCTLSLCHSCNVSGCELPARGQTGAWQGAISATTATYTV